MSSEEVSFMNGKWVISNPLVVQNYTDGRKLAQISILQVPLKSLDLFERKKNFHQPRKRRMELGLEIVRNGQSFTLHLVPLSIVLVWIWIMVIYVLKSWYFLELRMVHVLLIWNMFIMIQYIHKAIFSNEFFLRYCTFKIHIRFILLFYFWNPNQLDSKTKKIVNKYILKSQIKYILNNLKVKRKKSKLAYLKLSNEQCHKWKESWKSIMQLNNITIQFMLRILNSSPISKLRKRSRDVSNAWKGQFFWELPLCLKLQT